MMVNTDYMAWLTDIATDGHAHDCIYRKLFTQLMTTPYRWRRDSDCNRKLSAQQRQKSVTFQERN